MSLKVALILVLCLQTSFQETFDTWKGGRITLGCLQDLVTGECECTQDLQ